jgi:hypothetical protein
MANTYKLPLGLNRAAITFLCRNDQLLQKLIQAFRRFVSLNKSIAESCDIVRKQAAHLSESQARLNGNVVFVDTLNNLGRDR